MKIARIAMIFFIIAAAAVIMIAYVFLSINAKQMTFGTFYKSIDWNTKENTSEALTMEKSFEGFVVSNLTLREENGIIYLKGKVTNNTGTDTTEITRFDIIFMDQNLKVIDTIPGVISPVKNGESVGLNASIEGVTESFLDAFDIQFKMK